jgi:peptidoglycan/LPS O-acetylase OafA/YrhL
VNVQSPRFPLFDSLRAIAAGSVLLFHIAFFLGLFQRPHVGRYLTQLNIGVPIFFLISGFLLYRPFAAARLGRARPPGVVPYAIRRISRIGPAYWVALPIVALLLHLHPVLHDPLPYFGFAQVYDRQTLIGGYGVAWTLCVEVSFYAMLPLWAFAMRRLPGGSVRSFAISEALPLAAIFAFGVVWSVTRTETSHGLVQFAPAIATLPAFLDHFALGMALAVASVALAGRERQPAAVRLIHRAPWLPWTLAAAGWIALCNIGGGSAPANSEAQALAAPLPGGETARHVVRGFVALAVLLPAVFGDGEGGWVRRLLADRRLQWIGLISYSLYLWHAAIVQRLTLSGWSDSLGGVPFALVAIPICIAVATVSFYAVERPCLRLGRRLASAVGERAR